MRLEICAKREERSMNAIVCRLLRTHLPKVDDD